MPLSTRSDTIDRAIAAIQQLSRRDFLRFTVASVGVGGLASAGFGVGSAQAGLPDGIRFMGEAEYKVFHRLMEISLPVAGTQFVPPSEIPVMQTLDAALLGMMAPHALDGLKAGIKAFEAAPVKAHGRPFSQLGEKEAQAFCDAWGKSSDAGQRGLVTALKKLVALSYWANPPTWAPLGYDGPVSDKWGLTSIGVAPMPSE